MNIAQLAKACSLLALAGLCLTGCGSRRVTDTPRTATEQLLVSAAVDMAVNQLDFSLLEERKVFIDPSLVERVDETYVIAAVRARALAAGALLVPVREDAHYILELRSGGVGVNRNDYILGLPETQIPTPFGIAPIPEAAAFKSVEQSSACRLSFVVYRRDDGRFLYASGPAFGFAEHSSWWLFGAGPVTGENIRPPASPKNTATISASPSLDSEPIEPPPAPPIAPPAGTVAPPSAPGADLPPPSPPDTPE